MIKHTRKILESLKDLDSQAAADLFDVMKDYYVFIEDKDINEDVMFIFPDGRLLSTVVQDTIREITTSKGIKIKKVDRPAYHHDIYRFVNKYIQVDDRSKPNDHIHPEFNDQVAKYYNIILVATFHMTGIVMVPKGVEPTPQQVERLYQCKAMGWEISGYNLQPRE